MRQIFTITFLVVWEKLPIKNSQLSQEVRGNNKIICLDSICGIRRQWRNGVRHLRALYGGKEGCRPPTQIFPDLVVHLCEFLRAKVQQFWQLVALSPHLFIFIG